MVQATSGDGGKGSERRPCLVDKRTEDRNYLRVFGMVCPYCVKGIITRYHGLDEVTMSKALCLHCDGLGYVPKTTPKRMKKDEISD